MTRRIQCFAVVIAAAAVLLGYRQASAAISTGKSSVARVCVAGLRLDLAGEAGWGNTERSQRAGDAFCSIAELPRGLPGERLLFATSESGSVIAHRLDVPARAAFETALKALALQGWIESGASALARRRKEVEKTAVFTSAKGFLLATAMPAPTGEGSLVVAVALGGEGERER